ncbi:MAG: lipopolysaccharide biosynthesis protein RfbH [Lacrimispora sp.]
MFEHKTENEARQEILALVKEYCSTYHKRKSHLKRGTAFPTLLGYMTTRKWSIWWTAPLSSGLLRGMSDEFEKKLAKYLKIRFCSLVNSGSSANLLAFMALTSPLLGERQIKRGDEVITVAAGFPTTVTPMIQYGAVPVFVDVTIPQYNINTDMLEAALSEKTKAVMIAHTLGNPFDLAAAKSFCDRHGLWLVEDNCDALGSRYEINGEERFTGTIGDIGTSSFYPPHHMTMGEGGAVYTDNPLLNKIIRSFRDWGRDCVCPSGRDNLCGHRFDRQYGELPLGYDHKYVYSHFGYNLKATDMQAAIGCAQLEKFPSFVERRRHNFDRLYKGLEEASGKLILPEACPGSRPSWFGFLITCKEGVSRNQVVQYVESKGIQTRMLFAGNLTKHPCFDQMRESGEGFRIAGELTNTDRIMEDTFWVGVYPGMTDEMIDYMAETIKEAVRL